MPVREMLAACKVGGKTGREGGRGECVGVWAETIKEWKEEEALTLSILTIPQSHQPNLPKARPQSPA